MRFLVVFVFVLGSSFSLSAKAANSCHRILLSAPSSIAIEHTLKALAQMKYELDISKVQTTDDTLLSAQEGDFNKKQAELLNELNISQKALRDLLKKYIQEIQDKGKIAAKEKEQIRVSQSELVNTQWTSKKIPLPQSPNGRMIDADHGIAFLFYHDHMTLLDFSTGREEPFKIPNAKSVSFRALEKSGNFLFQVSKTEFKILDLKTKELKPFAEKALQGTTSGHWLSKESPDGRSVLLKNEQNEFLLLDIKSGDILSKGVFQHSDIHKFFMLDGDTVILNTQTELYRYSFSKKESKFLRPFQSQQFLALENGNYIYANGRSFYSFDQASGQTSTRTFEYPAIVLMADGPYLWIRTYLNENDKTLSMVNAHDLTDVPNGPSERFTESPDVVAHLDSDTMVISAPDDKFQTGIYNKRDLTLQQALNSGDATTISKTQELKVSSDRKTIVRIGNRSDFKSQIEVWTRK